MTQWMSQGICSKGSLWNSSQVHSCAWPTMPSILKLHSSVEMSGVGPAVRTGKPVSEY